jgi:hypothetical protein
MLAELTETAVIRGLRGCLVALAIHGSTSARPELAASAASALIDPVHGRPAPDLD